MSIPTYIRFLGTFAVSVWSGGRPQETFYRHGAIELGPEDDPAEAICRVWGQATSQMCARAQEFPDDDLRIEVRLSIDAPAKWERWVTSGKE